MNIEEMLNTATNIIGLPTREETPINADFKGEIPEEVVEDSSVKTVKADNTELEQKGSEATTISQTATKSGEGSIIPLMELQKSGQSGQVTPRKTMTELTSAGNSVPILTPVDPRNIHIPSTMSMLNIVDASTGN